MSGDSTMKKPSIPCPCCGETDVPLRRVYNMPRGMEAEELTCEECFPVNDECGWTDFELVQL